MSKQWIILTFHIYTDLCRIKTNYNSDLSFKSTNDYMSSGKHQAHVNMSKRIAEEMPRKMSTSSKKQDINSHASLNNTKKMFASSIGGKTNIKLTKNNSNIGKSVQKSRNPSKHSVSSNNETQIRTYTTVLQDRRPKKDHCNKSMLGSPEEINEKFRSDKTTKSSLTSSTTTHTNKIKKMSSDKSKKRNPSCFGSDYVKKQSNIKKKATKTTAAKYEMVKAIAMMDKNSNATIDQKRLERALDFDVGQNEMNQTIDCNMVRQEGINTIHKSDIIFKNRHSLASIGVNKSLKLNRKKSGSKSKKKIPISKIKKSTIHDLSSRALNATFENHSTTFKEGNTVRSGDSKSSSNKYLKRNKSTRFLKNIKTKDTSMFDKRKTSVGSISTSNLFHLPTHDKDPLSSKSRFPLTNMNVAMRRLMYGSKKSVKSGSLTTKNRSKVRVANKSFFNPNPNESKTMPSSIKMSTSFKMKKIQSTKQLRKPNDINHEVLPEKEGSSFKNSR